MTGNGWKIYDDKILWRWFGKCTVYFRMMVWYVKEMRPEGAIHSTKRKIKKT